MTIEISGDRELAQAMDQVRALTGRNWGRIVKRASVVLAMSARKASPRSAKRRKLERLSRAESGEAGGAKWKIFIESRSEWINVHKRDDKRRTITYSGALKGAWSGVLARLRGGMGGSDSAGRVGYRRSRAQFIRTREGAWSQLGVDLSYAAKIGSSAVRLAYGKAARSLVAEAERSVQKAAEKARL